MTIELMKSEALSLTKLEKIEFLRFLADLLSEEEQKSVLTAEQRKILLRRRKEVKLGKVKLVPAEQVSAKMIAKYGLQS